MDRRHFIYGASAFVAADHAWRAFARTFDGSMPGLKDMGACNGCLIGAWVGQKEMQDSAWPPLILKNFNLVTLGKLKWGFVRPTANLYTFAETDWVVEYCTAHGIALHGHNLCWNASNPPWLARTLTPVNAEKMLTDHITLVMKRYAGKISSYDVVNEPIASWMGRSDGLYTGPWLSALGPRYIDVAFQAAATADPKALRVLNIAHVEQARKANDIGRDLNLRLIKALLKRRVPVQAIGFESHLAGDGSGLSTDSRDSFVREIRELGLQVLITEMDIDDTRVSIDVRRNDAEVSRAYSDYLTGLLRVAQPSRVIFFSPGDMNNWYDRAASDLTYARRGGALHRPGLFDSNLRAKPSYAAVAAALKAACV